MKLLIVESPAKAKTINKYLGSDYKVLASYGHIRDLPSKDGSVDTDNNFTMNYVVNPQSSRHVQEIVSAMRNADTLLLASDPDREGEAIAWHVYEVLQNRHMLENKKVERVVFNAITKSAVTEAIKTPRQIDMDLVDAQQARRALDYLVGFNLSPVLWRKLPGSRSAGRVQSVALRLIVDREKEIEAFRTQEYWDILVDLLTDKRGKIPAVVTEVNGQKLEKFSLAKGEMAQAIQQQLEQKQYVVTKLVEKQVKRTPYAPFITSTLQQEASKKLGFSAKRTMSVAQQLYEGVEINGNSQGLITYMRTDGVYTAPEAITKTRELIASRFGDKYLPPKAIIYENKVKNSQEAHEAIRPTDPLLTPETAKPYLDRDQFLLYQLVWQRLVASQMANVLLNQVTVTIHTTDKYAELKATGSTIAFDGFYAVYAKETDDNLTSNEEDEVILPKVQEGDLLELSKVTPRQHFTSPPPRYTEASLVKRMEELGIGRPSTYASILSVIQDREYVRLEKRRFFTEDRGRIVTEFLKQYFTKYVEYDYTATLEDSLDRISNGQEEWHHFLQGFWQPFQQNVEDIKQKTNTEILDYLDSCMADYIFGRDEQGNLQNTCPTCKTGKLSLKVGKFGIFLGCSNYPECRCTRPLIGEGDAKLSEEAIADGQRTLAADFQPKVLGLDEATGENITLRKGPYGFYVQIGEVVTGSKAKPKRASLPKDVSTDILDLAMAKKLLSLPKELGKHPDTGKVIKAAIGPYGPYVAHDGKFYSVKGEHNIMTLTLDEAVEIIAHGRKKYSSTTTTTGGNRKNARATTKTTMEVITPPARTAKKTTAKAKTATKAKTAATKTKSTTKTTRSKAKKSTE